MRLQRRTAFSSRTPQANAPATVLEQRVSAGKRLNKVGHLITENYVLPTTAPGGAPEHNCRYHTPRLLFLFVLIRLACSSSDGFASYGATRLMARVVLLIYFVVFHCGQDSVLPSFSFPLTS